LQTNYTIGEASHDLAKNLLNLNSNGKESGNAQKLAPIIINECKRNNLIKPFLFPCGNQKQDILGSNLRANSIQLESIEVYETIPHSNLQNAIRGLEKEKEIHYIVYFSPTGVKFSLPFIRILHDINLEIIKLIAIGPSTQKCLHENNLQCFKMCDKPSPESLLDCLI
jgi:uroporphyrinogen-III synthase